MVGYTIYLRSYVLKSLPTRSELACSRLQDSGVSDVVTRNIDYQALQLAIDLTQMNKSFPWSALIERFHAYDITAAILVFQNIPVGVELFSYVNTFFCSNNFA